MTTKTYAEYNLCPNAGCNQTKLINSKQCQKCHKLCYPCKYYFKFNPDGTMSYNCINGDECEYSHNIDLYAEKYGLQKCNNYNECGNISKYGMCKSCYNQTIPCKWVFNRPYSCKFGEACVFSHSEQVYMDYYNLRWCQSCDNYCKKEFDLCKRCYIANQQECNQSDNSEKTCFGFKCKAKPLPGNKFCYECKQINNYYTKKTA